MYTKILLVDDHKLLREGLHRLISEQPDMQVVDEAVDGRVAVELASRLRPDVIIMDISMPGLNGIDAARQIKAAIPATKIIALSMHFDRRVILEMINAGASGYLLKDCAFEEVIRAIKTVVSQGTYLSPKIAEIVLNDYVNRIPANELPPLAVLSAREREVMQLLAEGRKTKDIAVELQVSVKTIETYRQQLMLKLNIDSIAELTKLAVKEGLTTL